MVGAAIIVIFLVVVIPVSVVMSGGLGAAIIGFFVQRDADERNPESELLDLNG